MLLLPDCHNKLLVAWNGPFKVIKCHDKVNYIIDQNGAEKIYHINMLKKYIRRHPVPSAGIDEETNVVLSILDPFLSVVPSEYPLVEFTPPSPAAAAATGLSGVTGARHASAAAVGAAATDAAAAAAAPAASAAVCAAVSMPDDDSDFDLPVTVDGKIESHRVGIDINRDLDASKINDIELLVDEFQSVFSETPGCTDVIKHGIILSSTEKFKPKIYPVPLHL